MESSEVPFWVTFLRSEPTAKNSFLNWITEQKRTFEQYVIAKVQTVSQLEAARCTYAELEVLERMMNWQDMEESEYARFVATFGQASRVN